MDVFRPLNSSESNLYTLRISLGSGSELGSFNTLVHNDVLISNNPNINVTKNYISSPSKSNLPKDFVVKYIVDGARFKFVVTYGKVFTHQPTINITPHMTPLAAAAANTNFFTPVITKSALNTTDNLAIEFLKADGTGVEPSSDGATGLLGFDVLITGPIKLGITTGNSNKGWAVNSFPEGGYTFLNLNLGSGNIVDNSVVISKNLKFLSSNGEIKKFLTSGDVETDDYSNSVWELNSGVNITNITPQLGMFLIIYRNDTSVTSISLTVGCGFNFGTNNKIEFNVNASNVILYGTSTTNFITLNQTGNINLTTS